MADVNKTYGTEVDVRAADLRLPVGAPIGGRQNRSVTPRCPPVNGINKLYGAQIEPYAVDLRFPARAAICRR